jgi:hypothetical protein
MMAGLLGEAESTLIEDRSLQTVVHVSFGEEEVLIRLMHDSGEGEVDGVTEGGVCDIME